MKGETWFYKRFKYVNNSNNSTIKFNLYLFLLITVMRDYLESILYSFNLQKLLYITLFTIYNIRITHVF